MEWINGETRESKVERLHKWHEWFAWYPVKIDIVKINGKERNVKAWLQRVERIFIYYDDVKYRRIGESK